MKIAMLSIFTSLSLIMSNLNAKEFLTCKKELETYRLDKGSFYSTCSITSKSFTFRAMRIASSGHICNLKGKAVLHNKTFHYEKNGCRVSFTESHNGMQTTFNDACIINHCGMQAQWRSGNYQKSRQ